MVTSFLKNGCVYFSILNTGVQIKEEAISHLYEVFIGLMIPGAGELGEAD